MSKDIREFLKYYLGQECIVNMKRYVTGTGINYPIEQVPATFETTNRNYDIDQCWGISVKDEEGFQYYDVFDKRCKVYDHFVHSTEFKLCLRKLESMSEEEMLECGNMIYDFSEEPELNKWEYKLFETALDPLQFDWLIKRGFWIFGNDWFDEEHIIDKTTVK